MVIEAKRSSLAKGEALTIDNELIDELLKDYKEAGGF